MPRLSAMLTLPGTRSTNCATTGNFWRGWNRLPEKSKPHRAATLRGFCINLTRLS
nr:MAG TPA: hypothetical protein [Caudoviricetes sp.]